MPLTTFFNLPETKRQKILDYAIAEFAQYDYDSASISRIVARAGIAKGSLYQYFVDKRDLYHYLLEFAAQKKTELLANARPPDPAMGVIDTIHWLFHEMASFQFRYPDLAKIGYRAVYGKSPLPHDVVDHAAQSTRQYFVELIEGGKKRGEIRPEID
ncbi:MAG TPA: TetR/AcrR family transcriptional regulator, partial [Anaerolineaceae bacterium]|nr:TetR/AcrR family transcriptional regulator [Anaerolineaceae bacterium]